MNGVCPAAATIVTTVPRPFRNRFGNALMQLASSARPRLAPIVNRLLDKMSDPQQYHSTRLESSRCSSAQIVMQRSRTLQSWIERRMHAVADGGIVRFCSLVLRCHCLAVCTPPLKKSILCSLSTLALGGVLTGAAKAWHHNVPTTAPLDLPPKLCMPSRRSLKLKPCSFGQHLHT